LQLQELQVAFGAVASFLRNSTCAKGTPISAEGSDEEDEEEKTLVSLMYLLLIYTLKKKTESSHFSWGDPS